MKYIILLSIALLMSACENTEKEKLEASLLKQQQEKAAMDQAILDMPMPAPVKLPPMKQEKLNFNK